MKLRALSIFLVILIINVFDLLLDKKSHINFFFVRPGTKPWLYYLEDDADDVLTDEGLTTVYTFPSSTLDLIVAQYSVNGSFLGYADTRGGLLQLCGNTRSILDAAYDFGTFYNTEVSHIICYTLF